MNETLYTAEATVTGGREGRGRTSDGRLEVDLDVPSEMGGTGGPGTNPEQLFAVGYAACFQSALLRIAAGRKLDLTGSRITARVGIGPLAGGGFGLSAALDLDAPQIDRGLARAVFQVLVCAGIEKRFHRVIVTTIGGPQQRRFAGVVLFIDRTGLFLEQDLDDVCVAA